MNEKKTKKEDQKILLLLIFSQNVTYLTMT